MEIKIFYIFIVLLTVSTGTVFAQESLLSIQTDDKHYDEGDTIVVSGIVNTIIGETQVIINLRFEDTLIDVAQIVVAKDGSFTKTFLAEGGLWKKSGEYTVLAFYGGKWTAETVFSYIPESEAIETTKSFKVDAGSHGPFDVMYTIKGGMVKDMIVDEGDFAVVVQINATDEGAITLDLPREFIGAEKQDGKDVTFIILIDGINASYQESVVQTDSRTITVNFNEGDSDIKIIGTYIVPEFGAIIMMILIIGITTVILVSRNKFQIKV